MAFYNKKEQLYLETDALGVGIGVRLLQVRDGNAIPKEGNNQQCSAVTNSICKQKLNKYGNQL